MDPAPGEPRSLASEPPAAMPPGAGEPKPLLDVHGLSRRFGGLDALKDVSVTVYEGEIFGLLGPNGAGKTVFQDCVSGAIRPTAGRVTFDGRDTTDWKPEKMCRVGLGRTFQIPRPFTRMTALENVRVAAQFGGGRSSAKEAAARARECLHIVQFEQPPETPMASLNAVQLKRVDLARAFASRPRLMLLDELAAGLMTGQLADLIGVIRRINAEGVTILMVEHILRTIVDLCSRVVVLQYGQKIAEGETGDVMRDPVVIEAYLGQKAAH
jgi:branched-chain amino acid transport system ATP-binding protein